MINGIFSPYYFIIHQQLDLLNIMTSILNSQIESVRNIEVAKACQKNAEEQALFQMEMYRKAASE